MSIIDRAASALAEKQGGDFGALTPEMQETVRDEVRVVLGAMVGASDQMLAAAVDGRDDSVGKGVAKYVWQIMIDAALQE